MTALARIRHQEAPAGGPDAAGAGNLPPVPAASFTLPSPPSTNKLFRNVAGKGRVRTSAYVDWRMQALTAIRLQKIAPVGGRVIVLVGVERHSGQADIDNRLKAALDAIVDAGVIEDDRFVAAAFPFWMPPANHLAHVAIYPCQRLTLTFHPSQNGASGALVVNAPFQDQGEDHGHQP